MYTKVFYCRLICCVTAILVGAILFNGCKKDNPVSGDNTLSGENLFPIATGRIWVATAYSLDTANSRPISSTIHREVSFAAGTATVGGKTAFHMIDSIYTPAGILETAGDSYLAIDNGDLLQWDETHGVWYTMFKKSAGLNTQYDIGQFQEVLEGPTVVNVKLTGTIFPKESVSAPIGTLQAYKLEIKITLSVGSISYPPQLMYMFFAEGYGPVRTYTPVQNIIGTTIKSEGEESLLVSKNF
jgi:hypothetical protein